MLVPITHCWLALMDPAKVDPLLSNVSAPDAARMGDDTDVEAVIAPAEKLPLLSRATMVDAVLAFVASRASVIAPEPLYALSVKCVPPDRENRLLPSATPEIVELVSDALAMFVSVLEPPLMDLFVRVCVDEIPENVSVPAGTVHTADPSAPVVGCIVIDPLVAFKSAMEPTVEPATPSCNCPAVEPLKRAVSAPFTAKIMGVAAAL